MPRTAYPRDVAEEVKSMHNDLQDLRSKLRAQQSTMGFMSNLSSSAAFNPMGVFNPMTNMMQMLIQQQKEQDILRERRERLEKEQTERRQREERKKKEQAQNQANAYWWGQMMAKFNHDKKF